MKKSSFRSKFGYYVIFAGSALGLGNMWRFPYVVSENGGGAFVLLYMTLALVIGAPLLISELILGKTFKNPVITLMSQLSKRREKNYHWLGWLPVIITGVVLSYYSVISGWVLHFITQFFVSMFGMVDLSESIKLENLLNNGVLQMLLASAHLLIVSVIVGKGVHEGLEKGMAKIMPLFAIFMIYILVKIISLSSFPQAVRFLFYPDFSKLTYASLAHVIGHVFFTLSVGFGMIVTYGTYLRDEDHAPTIGFRVATVDTVVSLISVLIIFPIAFQMSNKAVQDPVLLFEVLPSFFVYDNSGKVFGLIFFIGLYFAALNASVGLLELIVSNVSAYNKNYDRKVATRISIILILAVSVLPALSTSFLKKWSINEKSLIEILDKFLINWLLPIAALGVCMAYNKSMSFSQKEKDFVDKTKFVSVAMFKYWHFVIRWLAPIVIITALFLQAVQLFKS